MYMKESDRSYKMLDKNDSDANWLAFLSFLVIFPKASKAWAQCIEFLNLARCLWISFRWHWNHDSQKGVQYPIHIPECRNTDWRGHQDRQAVWSL